MTTEQAEAELTDAQITRRLWDVHQIEKVMAKHAWYHAALKNSEELEDLWVKKAPDPHFAQNQGFYIGYESLYKTYGEGNITGQQRALKWLHEAHPDVEVTDENLGAGHFAVHTQTTEVIEVAGDGQTAKGIWYTPGVVGGPGPDGKVTLSWMWERYGVDFAKEDGQWKIWHLHTYTDFGIPIGQAWQDESTGSIFGSGAGVSEEDLGFEFPKPDRESNEYEAFSYKTPPVLVPRIPEPYWTFSETFSY